MSGQDSHVKEFRYNEGGNTSGHSFNHIEISGQGRTHLGDVRNEYTINIGSTSGALPSSLWTVARPVNTLFTGRDDILQELGTIIRNAVEDRSRQGPCNIVISGIGGQGKSEICLQLAHRLRSLFWGVFWIDVSTTTLAENGFRDIANRLNVDSSSWENGRQALANTLKPWLLVLDNADDPGVDYQQYFPASASSTVILTSRNTECQHYATSKWLNLEGLSETEAQDLLFRTTRVDDQRQQALKADALAVARLLRSHPLALIQAGAYIAGSYCSMKDYPQVYEQQRKRLLTFRPSQAKSRYKDVYATFEASAEVLQSSQAEVNSDALQLLSVLAMYGTSRVPLLFFEVAWTGAQSVAHNEVNDEDLFTLTRWHVTHLPSLIETDAKMWDPFRLLQAVNLLKAFSLVSTDTQEHVMYVSMHTLVHAWAKDRLSLEQQHKAWIHSACLVALSRTSTILWPKYDRQMQPHIQAVVSLAMGEMFISEPQLQVCRILISSGALLVRMRDDGTLFTLTARLLKYLGLESMKVEPQWADLYYIYALNLSNCGQVKETLSLLEQVVKIREQRLAEDHIDRLGSQHELAVAYEANGQAQKAVSLLKHVVKIREQRLVENHPDRLSSQHALAAAYEANGQIREAVLLFEQVVKIREQLAEDHPDRLASQHELARCWWRLGLYQNSIDLMRQVVYVKRKLFSVHHPSRKVSEECLHYWQSELNQPGSA